MKVIGGITGNYAEFASNFYSVLLFLLMSILLLSYKFSNHSTYVVRNSFILTSLCTLSSHTWLSSLSEYR